MNRFRFRALSALLLVLLAAPGLARADLHPQDHDGWSIGFGVGGGTAGVSLNGLGSSNREGGAIGSFRVGYPITPQVSIAMEGTAWTKEENGTTLTFDATTFGVAVFPAEGLVLRGGLGFGSTTVAEKEGNVTLSSTESGFGAHLGAGYDFRVARTFAIGPQVDFGYTTFSGGNANWIGAALNFNWYFVKRK